MNWKVTRPWRGPWSDSSVHIFKFFLLHFLNAEGQSMVIQTSLMSPVCVWGGVLRLIPCPLKRFIRVQISPLFCLFFLGTETQGLLQILHHYKANVFHKPLILKLFSLPWTFCLCCLTCCSKHHTTHGRRTLLRSWQYRGKLARRVSSTMKHRQTCL